MSLCVVDCSGTSVGPDGSGETWGFPWFHVKPEGEFVPSPWGRGSRSAGYQCFVVAR